MGWWEDLELAAARVTDDLTRADDKVLEWAGVKPDSALAQFAAANNRHNAAYVAAAQAPPGEGGKVLAKELGATLATPRAQTTAAALVKNAKAAGDALDKGLDALGWLPWAVGGVAVLAGLFVAAPYVTPFLKRA